MQRKLTISAMVLVVLGSVALVLRRVPPDPAYLGTKLSRHLEAFAQDNIQLHREPPFGWIGILAPSPERDRAWQALPEIGTNALPLLLAWLEARETGWERWLDWFERKQSRVRFKRLSSRQKQMAAIIGLGRLGRVAEPALPVLVQLLGDSSSSRPALFALAWIHPGERACILGMTNALTRLDEYRYQTEVIATLASFGSKSFEAAPLLEDRLNSTNDNIRAMAAVALARIGAGPERIVPMIVTNLHNSSSSAGYPAPTRQMNLWALGEFGIGATIALPAISNYVNDSDARVSETAKATLGKIKSIHSDSPIAPP